VARASSAGAWRRPKQDCLLRGIRENRLNPGGLLESRFPGTRINPSRIAVFTLMGRPVRPLNSFVWSHHQGGVSCINPSSSPSLSVLP